MGQKAIPIGLRLKINRTWDSQWFSRRSYASYLQEDLKIRKLLKNKLSGAGLSRVVISRQKDKPHISAYVARPGLAIGKKGAGIEVLVSQLKKEIGKECSFNVVELRKPDLYAQVVADDIARQLEKRVFYRRAMKKAIQNSLKMGAKGVKVTCSGRLGGIEIARTEWYLDGPLPLHTFRSDIDYGISEAFTTSGVCGVKVWVYRGDVLEKGAFLDRRLGDGTFGGRSNV